MKEREGGVKDNSCFWHLLHGDYGSSKSILRPLTEINLRCQFHNQLNIEWYF